MTGAVAEAWPLLVYLVHMPLQRVLGSGSRKRGHTAVVARDTPGRLAWEFDSPLEQPNPGLRPHSGHLHHSPRLPLLVSLLL